MAKRIKGKTRILIADDKKAVLSSLELLLEDYFDEIVKVSNPNQIPALLQQNVFDVYLLDMNFAAGINTGNEGLFWLNEIRKVDPGAKVIFITAYGDVELAVKAVKNGARDFILKPWDNKKLIEVLTEAIPDTNGKKGNRIDYNAARNNLGENSVLQGYSPAMKKVYEHLAKVAKTDANVLILGENGTGKEVAAREIHRLSLRSNCRFLNVDISALNPGIIESELFGHKKGAFTGALEDRPGKFEAASGGTLLLDEMGNLSLELQAKLLTVLQNRIISHLGSSNEIPVDIRLICASNQDLGQMVSTGEFREDLYYRINTFTLHLPPLRDCVEDILPLAEYFIDFFAKKYNTRNYKLSKRAIQKLESAHWPGNIRELKHLMEKTVIMAEQEMLTDKDFAFSEKYQAAEETLRPLDELEKDAIARAIHHHSGNMTKVAKDLNISRQTLYNKMKKHGI